MGLFTLFFLTAQIFSFSYAFFKGFNPIQFTNIFECSILSLQWFRIPLSVFVEPDLLIHAAAIITMAIYLTILEKRMGTIPLFYQIFVFGVAWQIAWVAITGCYKWFEAGLSFDGMACPNSLKESQSVHLNQFGSTLMAIWVNTLYKWSYYENKGWLFAITLSPIIYFSQRYDAMFALILAIYETKLTRTGAMIAYTPQTYQQKQNLMKTLKIASLICWYPLPPDRIIENSETGVVDVYRLYQKKGSRQLYLSQQKALQTDSPTQDLSKTNQIDLSNDNKIDSDY